MFKKVMLSVLAVIIFVCLIQFVKETILNNPQKIYNNIFPKYKYLVNLSARDKVYNSQRDVTYALTYMNLIPLGKVEMFVEEMDGRILLKAVTKVAGYVKKIHKVEVQAQSLIDKNTLCPLKYTEIIKLPDKKKVKEMVYDQNRHIMERKGKKYKIPPLTFCPVSAFYYLQIQDFKLGKKYEMNIVSKEDIYLLKMEVVEKEGNIFKLKGSVRRRNLTSSHGTDFTLWISEDLRVPLLFKVTTEAGSLTARAVGGE